MAQRRQTGQLFESNGAFYVRYYKEGKRVAHRLCSKDKEHYAADCKAVKLLRDGHMLKVNSGVADPDKTLVSSFWKETFLPWAEKNLKPSSVHGYKKLWSGVLEDHFKGRRLSEYKTHHGSAFLTSLAARLSRNSVSHVRSLSSSIFGHAVNRGLIDRNPWREVKLLAKPKETKPTGHYTLAEVKEALGLLAPDPKAQVAFGLSFLLALRPGELAGLKWEDFSEDSVIVRRSAWRGLVGETKMGTSFEVPLIEPAKVLVKAWHSSSGKPKEGWIFPNPSGKRPLDMSAFANRAVRALLRRSTRGCTPQDAGWPPRWWG
jgi:integrase